MTRKSVIVDDHDRIVAAVLQAVMESAEPTREGMGSAVVALADVMGRLIGMARAAGADRPEKLQAVVASVIAEAAKVTAARVAVGE